MAYDPIQEDCLRLILGALHREHIYPLENAAFIARCMEDYHRDPAKLIVSGIDKAQVGKVAAEIRSLRGPEPYKGKGIKYEDETIRRKVGKSGGKK